MSTHELTFIYRSNGVVVVCLNLRDSVGSVNVFIQVLIVLYAF